MAKRRRQGSKHQQRNPSKPKPQTEPKKQPLGLRLSVAMLAGTCVLTQGLLSMTTNRRWQWAWLLSAASLMVILTLMTGMADPGIIVKKFFFL